MINLPFMNNAKIAINNHPEVNPKKDLAKPDKGHNFEHVIQNEESSSSNDNLVKSSSQEKLQTNSEQQTPNQESDVSQTRDSSSNDEAAPDLSEAAVDNQDQLSDVNVISLNQVLSELTIGLSQTIETQKNMGETDIETSDFNVETQEAIQNTVNDLAFLDQETTKAVDTSEQKIQTGEAVDAGVNLANLAAESNQVMTQNESANQSDEGETIQVDNTFQNDETRILESEEDKTSSNNDNAVNLKNFNYWQANGVQENLSLKSDFEKKSHDHVVALASKSLLEGLNPLALQKSQVVSKLETVDLKVQNLTNHQMNQMVDAKSVINQLYEGVRVGLKQEAQQIQVNLDPPEWGAMQLRMNIVKNDVNLSVVTESQAVKEALEKGVQALRSQFSQNGLNLANVNIGVGGGGAEQAEREARERLADNEKNQIKRLLKTPAGAAHGLNLITSTTGVIDSHV